MTKLIGALLALTALAVAIFLVVARRPRPLGPPRSRFALLVAGFVTLLTGGPAAAGPGEQPGAGPGGSGASGKGGGAEAARARQLQQRPEWAGIKEHWLSVGKLDGEGDDGIKKRVAERQEANRKLLAPLVRAGLLGQEGADAFNRIYADRVYHQLRLRSRASCYDPTDIGHKLQLTRQDLEKRLVLLQALRRKGSLKPEVQRTLEWTLKKQMEVILRIETLWAKQPGPGGSWETFREEEEKIRAVLGQHDYRAGTVEVKDSIQIRRGMEEALRLIRLIYGS